VDRTLTNLGKSVIKSHLIRSGHEDVTIASSGSQWVCGLNILSDECISLITNLKAPCAQNQPTKAPVFPNRKRFQVGASYKHDLLQSHQYINLSKQHQFSGRLHKRILKEWLSGHVVHGEILLPGVAMMEMALAVSIQSMVKGKGTSSSSTTVVVEGFSISAPVVVKDDDNEEMVTLHCTLDEEGSVNIYSSKSMDDAHAFAESRVEDGKENSEWNNVERNTRACSITCTESVDVKAMYSTMAKKGLEYGAPFRLIEEAWASVDGLNCTSIINLKNDYEACDKYEISPAVLDAALHTCFCLKSESRVPVAIDKVMYRPALKGEIAELDSCRSVVTTISSDASMTVFDCAITTPSGAMMLHMSGIHVRVFGANASSKPQQLGPILELSSEWKPSSIKRNTADNSDFSERVLVLVTDELVDRGTLVQGIEYTTRDVSPMYESVSGGSVDFEFDNVCKKNEFDCVVIMLKPGDLADRCEKSSFGVLRGMLKLIEELCDRSVKRIMFVCEMGVSLVPPAELAGLLQSARLEYSKVQISLLCCSELDSGDAIASEILKNDQCEEELEVIYLGDERRVKKYYVPRPSGSCMEISFSNRGLLENLSIHDQIVQTTDLGDLEVEVEVRAVGLNFRDVLNVLDMYPGDPGLPGCEYAGVVRRVGRLVEDMEVGTEVVGMGSGCLKSLKVSPRAHIHPKPKHLTMEEASIIPVVYCTVALALQELAALSQGETIIIHAAAGGVGMAAIQYAHRVGARVIGTASGGKHEILRSMGVDMIASSRDSSQFEADLQVLSLINKVYSVNSIS
jgi:hypothetical protein